MTTEARVGQVEDPEGKSKYDFIFKAEKDGFDVEATTALEDLSWREELQSVSPEFIGIAEAGLRAVHAALRALTDDNPDKMREIAGFPLSSFEDSDPYLTSRQITDNLPVSFMSNPPSPVPEGYKPQWMHNLLEQGVVLIETAKAATSLQQLVQPEESMGHTVGGWDVRDRLYTVRLPRESWNAAGNILNTHPATDVSMLYSQDIRNGEVEASRRLSFASRLWANTSVSAYADSYAGIREYGFGNNKHNRASASFSRGFVERGLFGEPVNSSQFETLGGFVKVINMVPRVSQSLIV